jgi:hypothetical protein
MKKIIFISAVIILLISFAGYLVVTKKPLEHETVELPPQKAIERTVVQPTPKATIDINDNLDQALQDLEQINNF